MIGPLMERALTRLEAAPSLEAANNLMASLSPDDHGETLPTVLQTEPDAPEAGEGWASYAARTRKRLAGLQERLESRFGILTEPLVAANALQTHLLPSQVRDVAGDAELILVELDPLVQVVQMDDAVEDLDLPEFRSGHPSLDGSGVRVAVLDSGIDLLHPHLVVAESVSTQSEGDETPGEHGTHCAGIIASRDHRYPGVAPGVELLNIKVLDSAGRGRETYVTQGIDAALDRGAQVLSMSLGFNHLPPWSGSGHGWRCPDGRCPLCVAVDNAVALDGVVAVVAAGNEHQRAEELRRLGHGGSFDTEFGCPGQARESIAVAAVTKRTLLPAGFSSRGPTSYGADKPDLAAPGVNITSTVPVPRIPDGSAMPNPSRAQLFARKSGTSMATPMVAGAVALLIQLETAAGRDWTAQGIRRRLLTDAVAPLPFATNVVGRGALWLGAL